MDSLRISANVWSNIALFTSPVLYSFKLEENQGNILFSLVLNATSDKEVQFLPKGGCWCKTRDRGFQAENGKGLVRETHCGALDRQMTWDQEIPDSRQLGEHTREVLKWLPYSFSPLVIYLWLLLETGYWSEVGYLILYDAVCSSISTLISLYAGSELQKFSRLNFQGCYTDEERKDCSCTLCQEMVCCAEGYWPPTLNLPWSFSRRDK